MTSFDFVNNKLVYKASIPEDYLGKIYEVGVYSLETDPASSEFSSRMLSTFDSATENWVNASTLAFATFGTTSTRIGADSLLMAPAVSTSLTYALKEIELDLSGYSAADTFNLAFNVAGATASIIRFRFLTDASNYYDLSIADRTIGYKIVEMTKGSATVTGTPNWSNITEIQVAVTSPAGTPTSVEFESIRIEDKDAANLDYILIARKVLPTPITSIQGQAQDVEFTLDISL